MKISAFEAYNLFLALKNHFHTESYDYFKYSGKLNASARSFLVKKDRICFEEASRHYEKEELIDLIISNILVGRNWFINIVRDEVEEAEVVWKEYVKRRESFTYMFSQDLDRLLDQVQEPRELFQIKRGSYPEILIQYMNRNVPLETLAALDKIVSFSAVFDKKLGKDDVLWQPMRLLIRKYKPFLKYDENKILKIVREKLLNKE